MTSKLKVGIVGGTGYTGVELLRLLIPHPLVEIALITSRKEAGIPVADIYPNLRGHLDLAFEEPDPENLAQCDLIFFATPNGIAMKQAPVLLDKGTKVIDLAADFRIKDIAVWEKWYGMQHASPEWVKKAVYGLPEFNREQIKTAELVANPGCYPTSIQLGLLPLMKEGWIDTNRIIADSKSGASGAGRGASVPNLLAESSDNFKAYGASGHRHLPEIKAGLSAMSGSPVGMTFVPHLLPMIRGIESTIYVELKGSQSLEQVHELYIRYYESEPFVDVLPLGMHPETRSVKSANLCRLGLYQQDETNRLIISSVIDNLVKGAAGQAVQNMNIMFGFPETTGLDQIALLP